MFYESIVREIAPCSADSTRSGLVHDSFFLFSPGSLVFLFLLFSLLISHAFMCSEITVNISYLLH